MAPLELWAPHKRHLKEVRCSEEMTDSSRGFCSTGKHPGTDKLSHDALVQQQSEVIVVLILDFQTGSERLQANRAAAQQGAWQRP